MDKVIEDHELDSPDKQQAAKRSTLVSVVVNIGLTVSQVFAGIVSGSQGLIADCLLYTSPSPRDYAASRMPSSA